MGQRTPLYDCHRQAGAKLVDFGGWDMPLHYGSQVEEHHAVRRDCGLFDVSHMTVVDVAGEQAAAFLRRMIANDIGRLKHVGQALYGVLCNERGGVIDDLITYRTTTGYRLVVNCATRDKDLAWLAAHAGDYAVTLTERPELAMLAVQGPNARAKVAALAGEHGAAIADLKPFHAVIAGEWFVARTGYTGEDGLEIILPGAAAVSLWQDLLAAGVAPCGLGARDTLRLEAGLNLYGHDMDEDISPLEAGLGWTIAWEPAARDFIGRDALEAQRRDGPQRKLVGLVLEGKGVLRDGQIVIVPELGEGVITSGSFSPTLGQGIALARVPVATDTSCLVEMRGKQQPARVVQPPFVRHGKIRV